MFGRESAAKAHKGAQTAARMRRKRGVRFFKVEAPDGAGDYSEGGCGAAPGSESTLELQ